MTTTEPPSLPPNPTPADREQWWREYQRHLARQAVAEANARDLARMGITTKELPK